jgi:hypothetical protein
MNELFEEDCPTVSDTIPPIFFSKSNVTDEFPKKVAFPLALVRDWTLMMVPLTLRTDGGTTVLDEGARIYSL